MHGGPAGWVNTQGTASWASGTCTIACSVPYSIEATTGLWDLTSSVWFAQVTPPPVGNNSTEIQIILGPTQAIGGGWGPNGAIYFAIGAGAFGDANTMVLAYWYDGATYHPVGSVTYDPVATAWLRFQNVGTLVEWSYGADGSTWSGLGSATVTFPITSLYAVFGCGFDTAGNSASNGAVSNINSTPGPPSPVSPPVIS